MRETYKITYNQGNLKGEYVVAAILPSCMEASLFYLRIFSSLSPPNNFVKRELPFSSGLKSRTQIGYHVVNHAVR